MYRVLGLEDNPGAADVLAAALSQNNFDFDIVSDGSTAIEYINQYPYDVYIIDIMMEGVNGLEVIKAIRKLKQRDPVIITSALAQSKDVIHGFASDTDDYLTKPFYTDELMARIYSQIRRNIGGHSNQVEIIKNLNFNVEDHLFYYKTTLIELSPHESKILFLLKKNQPKYIKKELIMDYLYHGDNEPGARIIDTHICNLRKRLGKYFGDQEIISTHRHGGYCLSDGSDTKH